MHTQLRVSSIQHIMHECANTRTIHSGLVVRQHGCCVYCCCVASALQESVSVSLPSTPADLPLIPRTWCWVVVVFRPSLVFQSLEVLIRFSHLHPSPALNSSCLDIFVFVHQGRSTMNVIHMRFQRNLRVPFQGNSGADLHCSKPSFSTRIPVTCSTQLRPADRFTSSCRLNLHTTFVSFPAQVSRSRYSGASLIIRVHCIRLKRLHAQLQKL